MADPKTCPKCGSSMTLHPRPKPPGSSSMFMDEDHWVCSNPKCGHVIVQST